MSTLDMSAAIMFYDIHNTSGRLKPNQQLTCTDQISNPLVADLRKLWPLATIHLLDIVSWPCIPGRSVLLVSTSVAGSSPGVRHCSGAVVWV